MKSKAVLLFVLVLVGAAPSWAQSQSSGWGFQQPSHRIELLGYGGYLWSGSQDVWYGNQSGEIDVKDSAIWGIEADIATRPGAQVVLLYHRQDSGLEFRYRGQSFDVGDVALEHWHVGGLSGIQRGNVMPFAMVTLGGTRIVPQFAGGGDDVWKFSMLFGLGAKIYVNERVGLRVQGRLPWILLEGGGSVACGSGGCYSSFGGYGIVQIDVSGGLFVMF